MTSVHIDLDLKVVQKAINAKVAPAVDKILSTVDIPARIEKALLEVSEKRGGYGYAEMLYWSAGIGRGHGEPLIDSLVRSAIHEAAQDYVKKAVKSERAKIEAAFAKMLRDSSETLARTLIASMEGALKDDWRFEIETRVSPKEIEHWGD